MVTMSKMPYFVQECLVCGRPTRIRVEYLGRRVHCRHCGGRFVAADSSSRAVRALPSVDPLLYRADQLLDISHRRLHPRLAAGWTS